MSTALSTPYFSVFFLEIIEPPHEKKDQPGHSPSLISCFAVRMNLAPTERTAKTLIRLGGRPG